MLFYIYRIVPYALALCAQFLLWNQIVCDVIVCDPTVTNGNAYRKCNSPPLLRAFVCADKYNAFGSSQSELGSRVTTSDRNVVFIDNCKKPTEIQIMMHVVNM